ncbi:MAG TPA: GerMN domain-containing protein [Gaiellaceae bacterium]|nr:GerMN domain-containing protein [Gaiellaceae bacterium]
MKALLLAPAVVLAASAGFLAASCGANGDATPAGPVPSAPAATTETAETLPPPTTTNEEGETVPTPGVVTYQVWFQNSDGLFVTYRTQEATPRVGTAALEALLAGPSAFEAQQGLSTSIPDGTQLLGLTIDEGIASVDLTSEYGSGGGTLSMQSRLAQVVFTLTQFPTVGGVVFSLDGKPIDVLGGEGIIIDHPLSRRDFADLLPPILVVSPTFEENVSSPVVVRGSANVFEANVLVKILDESGVTLAETFTTATCGTGCRGTYRVAVPFTVDREQIGTIVVHDDDAAGVGRPPHEVRIPVRLLP